MKKPKKYERGTLVALKQDSGEETFAAEILGIVAVGDLVPVAKWDGKKWLPRELISAVDIVGLLALDELNRLRSEGGFRVPPTKPVPHVTPLQERRDEVAGIVRTAMQEVLRAANVTVYVNDFDEIRERAVQALLKDAQAAQRIADSGTPSDPVGTLVGASHGLVEALSACGVRVKSLNGVHERVLRDALEQFKKALGATE